MTLSGSFTGPGNISWGGTSTHLSTISGPIATGGGITVNDGATLKLAGDNTFTGVLNLAVGTLEVGSLNRVVGGTSSSNAGAPTTVGNGTIQFANSNWGRLRYVGAGESTDRAMTMGNSGADYTSAAIESSGSGALVFENGLTIGNGWNKNRLVILDGNNTDANEIQGAIVVDSNPSKVTLTKNGIGTWVLSGSSNYTGMTTINAGVLQLSSSTAMSIASGTAYTLNTGGALAIGASFADSDIAPLLSKVAASSVGTFALGGNTAQNIDLSAFANVSLGAVGAVSYSGDVTPNGTTYRLGGGGGTLTYNNVLSGTGMNLVVNSTAAGARPATVVLAGANTYDAGTTINSGTLQLGNATALGASTGALALNHGALNLAGYDASIGALSGSSGVLITNSGAGENTLTSTVASGTSTYAGNIADGAGAVALTKSGSGTLILSGSLTMAGLNANNGVTQLALSGSIGAISISAAGKLELTANGVNTAKVLDTSSLSIAGGGGLDLWDNALILRDQTGGINQGANLSTVQSLVNTAFDNGAWDKPGITSSTVIADLSAYSVLTVMVYDNTVLGVDSFEGINNLLTDNGGNQVMLKTTYLGDFDGNGIVNSADYGWLDFYYGYGLTVGDLNGDGQVNSADYNGIDYGYGYQAYGVLASGAATPPASAASAPAAPEAVPEPGTLGLLLAGALGLFGFRRKNALRS